MNAATQAYHDISSRQHRDELILAHLPLVRHAVGRMRARLPAGLDVENLESAGVLGLVEAANNFDPTRGVKFEVFANWRIRGAIVDELRRNCPLPQQLLEKIAQVRRAYEATAPAATVETLAAATSLSPDEVNDCLAGMRMVRMVSLDSVPETRQPQREDSAADVAAQLEDQKRLLSQGIAQLAERERVIVTLYFLEDMRLKEIGQVLHLSESRVSRLLNAALFHLGEYMRLHEA